MKLKEGTGSSMIAKGVWISQNYSKKYIFLNDPYVLDKGGKLF